MWKNKVVVGSEYIEHCRQNKCRRDDAICPLLSTALHFATLLLNAISICIRTAFITMIEFCRTVRATAYKLIVWQYFVMSFLHLLWNGINLAWKFIVAAPCIVGRVFGMCWNFETMLIVSTDWKHTFLPFQISFEK